MTTSINIDVEAIIRRFIELSDDKAMEGCLRMSNKPLSESDVKILFLVVQMAGFKPKEVVLGDIFGIQEPDARIGVKPPLNGMCQYKVINQEGSDDHQATLWMNHLVLLGFLWFREFRNADYEHRFNAVCFEIVKSKKALVPA